MSYNLYYIIFYLIYNMDNKDRISQLRQRLRDKINRKKLENTKLPNKEIRRINNIVDNDKKLINNDSRITQIMKSYYLNAMASSQNLEVTNPVTILDNLDEHKRTYYLFLVKYMSEITLDINLWKKEMMNGLKNIEFKSEKDEYLMNLDKEAKKKYKTYFSTPYILYMGLMTGIDIMKDFE